MASVMLFRRYHIIPIRSLGLGKISEFYYTYGLMTDLGLMIINALV